MDFTYGLTGGTANSVIRFEALNSFVNEIIGVDNVRVCSGDCVVPGLAGDYNGDDVVNAADYVVFRNNLNMDASAFAEGSRDPSLTGPVGPADYDFWVTHFGETAGGGTAAVPESAGVVLALVAAFGIAGFHRPGRRRANC